MEPSKPPLLEDELSTIASLARIRTKPGHFLSGFSDTNMLNALLQTASDLSITANHATRAIRALVSVLQKLRSEADSDLPTLLFGVDDMWFRCLDLLLQRSESINAKLTRQFLTLLLALLKMDHAPEMSAVLQRLLEPLKDLSSGGRVKPALHTVAMILSKETVPAEVFVDVFLQESGRLNVEGLVLTEKLESVFSKLFFWGKFHELTHQVGQLSSLLYSQLRKQLERNSVPWIKPLLRTLRDSPEALLKFRSHIFPALFSVSFDDYYTFLHESGLEMLFSNALRGQECDRGILLAALQVGKEKGFVTETSKMYPISLCLSNEDSDDSMRNNIERGETSLQIHMRVLCQLLYDVSSSARLAGFSLIVSTNSTTKPFSTGALDGLKRGIPVLFLEQDSSVRQEILSLLPDMINRIRAATFKLIQSAQRVHSSNLTTLKGEADNFLRIVAEHETFMRWLVDFIPTQLHPGAGYQRHIFALKLLGIVLKPGIDPSMELQSKAALNREQWEFSVKVLTPVLQRLLGDLILDPFEDVRSMAASLLQASFESGSIERRAVPAVIYALLERAESKMLLSGRADHADGLGRMYEIIFYFATFELSYGNEHDWKRSKLGIVSFLVDKLERSIEVAKQNISLAIAQFSMHGVLLSLR
jgi:hypothetical protein